MHQRSASISWQDTREWQSLSITLPATDGREAACSVCWFAILAIPCFSQTPKESHWSTNRGGESTLSWANADSSLIPPRFFKWFIFFFL